MAVLTLADDLQIDFLVTAAVARTRAIDPQLTADDNLYLGFRFDLSDRFERAIECLVAEGLPAARVNSALRIVWRTMEVTKWRTKKLRDAYRAHLKTKDDQVAMLNRDAELKTAEGEAKRRLIVQLQQSVKAKDEAIAQLQQDAKAKDEAIAQLQQDAKAKDEAIAQLTADRASDSVICGATALASMAQQSASGSVYTIGDMEEGEIDSPGPASRKRKFLNTREILPAMLAAGIITPGRGVVFLASLKVRADLLETGEIRDGATKYASLSSFAGGRLTAAKKKATTANGWTVCSFYLPGHRYHLFSFFDLRAILRQNLM